MGGIENTFCFHHDVVVRRPYRRWAKVPKYLKTKRGSGYADDSYRASFIGIAPLSTESLTIFVSIDDPGLNSYSGGVVAAPVFAKIAESSLNYLGYYQDE